MARPRAGSLGVPRGTVTLEKDPEVALVYRVRLDESQSAALRQRSQDALLRQAFRDNAFAPAAADIRVAAEGDSWSNLLWPVSGYPPTFVNLIDETKGFYVNNIGWPGDRFEEILAAKHYLQLLDSNSFRFFIFSGGGNDVIGGEALKLFLKPRGELGASPAPEQCIQESAFDKAVQKIGRGYRTLVKEVKETTTKTRLLIHGYDHAVPRVGGQWLGGPLAEKGYNPKSSLARRIIALMIDRFYAELADVASEGGARVILVDCRGACAGNWHDELHPNAKAAAKLAGLFLDRMGGAPVPVARGRARRDGAAAERG